MKDIKAKDVPGYEGLYLITSCGKVWSYRSKKFLKPYNDGFGYWKVELCKGGVRKQIKVSRLVLMTYNPVEGMENLDANHIDENKDHNWLSNLNWMTHKENINYGTRNERVAKANSRPVRCVETGEVFESQVSAAAAMGFASSSGIANCLNGRAKTAGGYHWERYYEKKISQNNQ